MAEFKFGCPHCGQKILVEELWSGHELQCPGCHKALTVPPNPAAAPAPRPPASGAYAAPVAPGLAPAAASPPPPPPPSGEFGCRNPPAASGSRLAIGASKAPVSSAPPRPGAVSPLQRKAARAKSDSNGGVKKILTVAAVVIVLGVGGYFGYGFVKSWQEKANKSDANGGSGSGQVGHIQALNATLDATDPDRRGAPPRSKSMAMAAAQPAQPTTQGTAKDLPLATATWTLDVDSAKIPDGRANGMLSATNFVVDNARVDTVGAVQVLSLKQGAGPVADREVLIYLRLKPGENLGGQKLTISKDIRGAAAPQVLKRWKVDPRYAPRSQPYAGGYAMKLEMGPMGSGTIPGKIYLALPDSDQSFVAGAFDAVVGAPVQAPVATAPVAPVAAPASGKGQMDDAMQRRYGIKH